MVIILTGWRRIKFTILQLKSQIRLQKTKKKKKKKKKKRKREENRKKEKKNLF